MPTRNINLPPHMERFVAARLRAGNYAHAGEALRAGLRALERAELEDHARLTALRAAKQAGEESGVADDDAMAVNARGQAPTRVTLDA